MNTPNATRNSHVLVDNVCCDCGDIYQVALNAAGQSSRCPNCRRIRQIERVRERRRYNVGIFDPIQREPRQNCRVCGKPAGRYPHYCTTQHYILDFRVAYNADQMEVCK